MNAQAYKGYRPYQTPAFREDRSLYNALGKEAYDAHRQERQEYYRELLRKVRENKA